MGTTRRALTAVVLISGVVAGGAIASPATLLYSVTSGDLRVSGSGAADRISLPAAAPMAWFTNRPRRVAGTSTVAALVSGWRANGFDTDPPNAALVATRPGSATQVVVTLRDPRSRNGRVSFGYSVVRGGAMLGMRSATRLRVGRYRGEMFIDSATIPPCTPGDTYVHSPFSQCVTSGTHDYRFLNDAADGWQTTYACGAGLRVRHFAPGDTTYVLPACPAATAVGGSQRLTLDFGSTTGVTYSQNSFVGVPAGVTFTFSADPLCGVGLSAGSGVQTCVLPAGSQASFSRPTNGNTRLEACGLNGSGAVTYDSTAAGVRGASVRTSRCDAYAPVADVPGAQYSVVIHAQDDTRILVNAG